MRILEGWNDGSEKRYGSVDEIADEVIDRIKSGDDSFDDSDAKGVREVLNDYVTIDSYDRIILFDSFMRGGWLFDVNSEYIKDSLKDAVSIEYLYGGGNVLLVPEKVTKETVDEIEDIGRRLSDYHVLDDDAFEKLEYDAFEEAYDDFIDGIKSDYGDADGNLKFEIPDDFRDKVYDITDMEDEEETAYFDEDKARDMLFDEVGFTPDDDDDYDEDSSSDK